MKIHMKGLNVMNQRETNPITLWDRKDGIFPNIVCNEAELLELKVGCCGSSGRESLEQF